jgi:hypothetical protein
MQDQCSGYVLAESNFELAVVKKKAVCINHEGLSYLYCILV